MKIVVDTREKKPFSFSFFDAEIVRKKLDTGDYSIVGFEEKISIDRKASASELYINCFAQYPRFKKELLRMGSFDEKYIVCEFPYYDISSWPACSLDKEYQFTNQHFMDKIEHIIKKYGVKFVFCGDRVEAEDTIFRILKEYYERN